MGGGLMQLLVEGIDNAFLTGDPEISFFKVVYRRHTNFAIESVQQTINGTIGYGNNVYSVISRDGDLITNMRLEIDVTIDDYNLPFYKKGHTIIE